MTDNTSPAHPGTAGLSAIAEAQQPAAHKGSLIPGWAQILAIVALFIGVKEIPGLPYSGQVFMFLAIILSSVFLRMNGETWRDMGLRWSWKPVDLAKGAGMVVLVFASAVAANGLVQWLYVTVTGVPVERTLPDVSTLGLFLIMMALVWTTNSFGEEMVFRGFLMKRFSTIFGGTRFAWILAAFAQAMIFGLGHAYQGLVGILITGMVGLVFGLLYLVARRNLWPMIFAHGLINSVAFTVLHLQAIGAFPAS